MSDDFDQIIQSIADGVKPQQQLAAPVAEPLRYSPELLVDVIINNPDFDHKQLGAIFGRGASWVSACIASQAFQEALEPRRHEVLDPSIAATMEERFKALSIRALTVLNDKLDAGKALPDSTILKAVEIGVKALGMGQKAPEALPPPETELNSSERVANRILEAMAKRKAAEASNTVDVVAVEVPNG